MLFFGLIGLGAFIFHGEPAAGGRRQPQILLRRPRPRLGVVRDRAQGRGRTGQSRAILRPGAP